MNVTPKITRNIYRFSVGIIPLILFIFIFTAACEEENGGSNYDPPESHTINKDGHYHNTGLDDPLTNCISCHGADLQGGTVGVSCYECHEEIW